MGGHAEGPPPRTVMPSQLGEILIVAQPARPEARKVPAPVIASAAVLQQLQSGPPVAAAYLRKRGMNGSASDDRPAVVAQVAKQVLGKLQDTPTADATEQWQSMATAFCTEVLQQVKDHVDGVTGALGARVMTLEGQVAGVEKKVDVSRADVKDRGAHGA